MTDPLLDLARQVLTQSAQLLTDAEFPPPDRRFVSYGRVVTFPGCETLGVVVDRVYAGQPGSEQRTVPPDCRRLLAAQLSVVLNRCVPTVADGGDLPDWSTVNTAGESMVEQGWVLIDGFRGLLSNRPAGGAFVGVAGPLEALQPAGGIGGWRLTLNVQV